MDNTGFEVIQRKTYADELSLYEDYFKLEGERLRPIHKSNTVVGKLLLHDFISDKNCYDDLVKYLSRDLKSRLLKHDYFEFIPKIDEVY